MKKSLLSMATLLVLLSACQKENIVDNDNNGKIQVKASLSQGESTKVDVNHEEKGASVYWINKDAVSVFGTANESKKFLGQIITSTSEKSKRAVFEGSVTPSEDNNYYILYPYQSSHESGIPSSIPLDLSTIESGDIEDLTYLGKYMYMVSKKPGQIGENDNLEFAMEHLTALVRFNVHLGLDIEGLSLMSMTIQGDNLKSSAKLNVYDKTVVYTPGEIRVDFLNPIELNIRRISEFTMVFFPTDAQTLTVRFEVFDRENGIPREGRVMIDIPGFEAGKRYTGNMPVVVD